MDRLRCTATARSALRCELFDDQGAIAQDLDDADKRPRLQKLASLDDGIADELAIVDDNRDLAWLVFINRKVDRSRRADSAMDVDGSARLKPEEESKNGLDDEGRSDARSARPDKRYEGA